MAQPYIGEIRMFAGNFAPADWMMCDGSLLSISENETLFSLIGTTFGGDGQTTFALPDLRGRIPIHQSGGFALGQVGGQESVTLTAQQVPSHRHPQRGNPGDGTAGTPAGNVPAGAKSGSAYFAATPAVAMHPGVIPASGGGGQPHDNMMPTLAITFIISLFGIFPTQN